MITAVPCRRILSKNGEKNLLEGGSKKLREKKNKILGVRRSIS
jgi:hypothetical protein